MSSKSKPDMTRKSSEDGECRSSTSSHLEGEKILQFKKSLSMNVESNNDKDLMSRKPLKIVEEYAPRRSPSTLFSMSEAGGSLDYLTSDLVRQPS